MNALKKLNEIYGKYLFAVIPAVTLILAIYEVLYEISHGDVMHIVAYILMGFVSISFCGFYLMSGKQKISYCLIELWLFVYTVFLTLDNHDVKYLRISLFYFWFLRMNKSSPRIEY